MLYHSIQKNPFVTICLILCCVLFSVSAAMATSYVSQGPFVTPAPGNMIPFATQVPGKEYSHNWDWDSAHVYDMEQNVAWDGAGGVMDGLDYGDFGGDFGEVDAIAQTSDALFQSLRNNTSALAFSVTNDPNILLETTAGMLHPWVTSQELDMSDPMWPDPIFDVDGLDLWGDEPQAGLDATMFSIQTDNLNTSVWSYDKTTGMVSPVFFKDEIAYAIGITDPSMTEQVDVDAMMINAVMSDGFPVTREIIFSIAPIPGLYDGGEIWYWDGVPFSGNAQFLNHGGHIWDTAFDVMGTLNTFNENINALEAVSASFSVVPEPVSSALFITGAAALGFRRFLKAKA